MSRSSLFIAASVLVLAACQPATEAPEEIVAETPPVVAEEDREFVQTAFAMLGDPPYAADTWSTWTSAVKEATGRKGKSLFMPLRLAITGQAKGPEMADVMPLLTTKPKLYFQAQNHLP